MLGYLEFPRDRWIASKTLESASTRRAPWREENVRNRIRSSRLISSACRKSRRMLGSCPRQPLLVFPRSQFLQQAFLILMTSAKEPVMNKYALMARDHWTKYAPNRVAAMGENATEFFTHLGEQAATEVEATSQALEAELPSDLPYLERVARLRSIQKQAEDATLPELIFLVDPELSVTEELDALLGELPTAAHLIAERRQIEWAATDQAELEGWDSPVYSEDQELELARIDAMLTLIDPAPRVEELTEPEARDLLLKLRTLPASR